MKKMPFVALAVVVALVVPATTTAVEITIVDETAIVSDLTLPDPPGRQCAGTEKGEAVVECLAQVGICIQQMIDDVYQTMCRVYQNSANQVQVPLPVPGGNPVWIKACDHVSGELLDALLVRVCQSRASRFLVPSGLSKTST
jgi:hypothetical protein